MELIVCLDALISGSWDRTLKFWDVRAENPQQSSHEAPERIYQIDLADTKLVVAMASRLFHVYDIRRMDKPDQVRESSLKYMTRSLGCMSDKTGKRHEFSTEPKLIHTCRLRNRLCRGSYSSRVLRYIERMARQEVCL
jgi:WD40 repeat protein